MRECPHCGCELNGKTKPRSTPQLRRYFAMIRAYYHHWPETADRQFSSVTELRKWAQMKAGHYTVRTRIPLVGVSADNAKMLLTMAFRGSDEYSIPVIEKGHAVIYQPESINFHTLGPAQFSALSDAVETVLEQETGLKPDDVLKETERAA